MEKKDGDNKEGKKKTKMKMKTIKMVRRMMWEKKLKDSYIRLWLTAIVDSTRKEE